MTSTKEEKGQLVDAQVPVNERLRTTFGMTADQIAARHALVSLLERVGSLGFVIGGLITPSAAIAVLQNDSAAHAVVERNEVSPDSLRTLICDFVCV